MDKAKLALEIQCELDQLRALAQQSSRLLAVTPTDRREWDAVAGAKYVADVWMAVENLCKRRYAALEIPFPQGPDSHSRILADLLAAPHFAEHISANLSLRLKKYLAFRHRFTHGYGQIIMWGMVEEPLRHIPGTVTELTKIWADWLDSLP